jgi:hypothetical protein
MIQELGFLWQTDTITPAHEHFFSYLIKQKLMTNTEKLQSQEPSKTDRVFVLYLPMNEIHELGIMYLNYEILNLGYKTIYLGESVPIDSLKDMKKHFDNITYVCYMTVEPNKDEVNSYVKSLKQDILDETSNLYLIGRMTENVDSKLITEKITTFNSIKELVEYI